MKKHTAESIAKTNTINGRKGRNASPWGKWQPAVVRYPELNTSTKLREPCTYRGPK
jgi:hypothetical protein